MRSSLKYKSKLEQKFHRQYHQLPYEGVSLSYVKRHTYTPDFQVSPTAFIELKGRFDAISRARHRDVLAANPTISILLVLQSPQTPINKGSKTTGLAWAKQHGFEACGINDHEVIANFIKRHTNVCG